MSSKTPESIKARWSTEWPRALEAWSSYTQLRPPEFMDDDRKAAADNMAGEIAAIRLQDQRIMVNLDTIRRSGLEEFALPKMAHEIGHHVYVPGNLTDNARMMAAIGRMLTGLPQKSAGLVANLYGDLLINDRLQRKAGVNMAAVYRKLTEAAGPETEVWKLYMRTYEHLWSLAPNTLSHSTLSAELDADGILLARIIRSFSGDWLGGARRFATVIYPYLARDEADKKQQTLVSLGLHDTRTAGLPAEGQEARDAIPDGLAAIDPSEIADLDDFDRDIVDPLGDGKEPTTSSAPPSGESTGTPGQQYREPFEYGQLLAALGLKLEQTEVTRRYYRERALPHLIPFPTRRSPIATEPVAEGYAEWGIGDPIEDFDAIGSVLRSPVVIPGVTTLEKVYGEAPGSDPKRVPMDLDVYVDSSGSMPAAAVRLSYLALAGTILALSALRAGAAVQATLWSGAGRFQTTKGFSRDESQILGIVTGQLGGSTAFPLHILRDTYDDRPSSNRKPVHIVVISDDGADTMLLRDERDEPGEAICRRALERANGGGTLVLNMAPNRIWQAQGTLEGLGFVIHRISQWEDLVDFAREFVRRVYGAEK